MNPEHEVASGYFIQFAPKEERVLKNALGARRLNYDKDGIKKLLFTLIEGEAEEPELVRLVRQNPEVVQMAAFAFKGLKKKILG